jgi:Domain of Unknown Function (DUF748)
VGLVALYALFGFFVAPRIVRGQIMKAAAEKLTTTPRIDKIRVNPFALSLTLSGFSLEDPSGDPVFAFDRFYVRFAPLRSLLGTPTLSRFYLDRPRASLEVMPDSTFNWVALFKPQPAAAPPDTSPPPTLRILRFAIIDGSLAFQDRTRRPAFGLRLAPLTLKLSNFSTTKDSRNGFHFDARSEAGEGINWDGNFTLAPARSIGTITLDHLKAPTIKRFLGDQIRFALPRGTVDLSTRYDVDLTPSAADVRLDTLTVRAHDLALADFDSTQALIEIPELGIAGARTSARRLSVDLGHVTVRGASLRGWLQNDGQINYVKWFPPPADTTAPPWAVHLEEFTLQDGKIHLEDQRFAPPARVDIVGADLKARDIHLVPDSTFALSFACSLATGGRVTGDGTARLAAAPITDLKLEAHGIGLEPLEPYVGLAAKIDIRSGTADAKGRLQFNSFGARGPMLRFVGDASSRDFTSIDRVLKKEFIQWGRLDLKGLSYDFQPSKLWIKDVIATKSYARVVIGPDQIPNVVDVAVPPDSMPAAFKPTGPPDTMQVRIDRIKINNSSAYFADFSLTPNFATGIESMNGEIRELSSAQAAHAAILIDGKVDDYAPVKIFGTLNPLNQASTTDLTMSFKNIELTTFTPYSGKFAGYKIERGKMSLDLHYHIEGRQLVGENKMFLNQFTLGEKTQSPDATKLPVKLAVALLKDREGNIDIDLPVSGSLDDPHFSVMRLIIKALLSLLTKLVLSPFKLLGSLFGGGGDVDLSYVDVPYGTTALSADSKQRLDQLAKGLDQRPALKLEIAETLDAANDSTALVQQRYEEMLRRTRAKTNRNAANDSTPVSSWPTAEYQKVVAATYQSAFGAPPKLEISSEDKRGLNKAQRDSLTAAREAQRTQQMADKLRGTVVITHDDLQRLARARSEAVRDYLITQASVPSERIFLVSKSDSVRVGDNGARVGLALTAD